MKYRINVKNLTIGLLGFGLTACATTSPTPISSATINQLKYASVDVDFNKERDIGSAYDKAVLSLIESDAASIAALEFKKYVSANGGAGTDNDQLAERYIEYRIGEEISSNLKSAMNGTKPVDIKIDIDKVIVPNAATMFLVGEIKAVLYDLDVVDANTQEIIIDLTKPSSPYVEKSLGAVGGLVGLAIRSAKNTKLTDLEQLASAVSTEVKQILLGPVVNKTVLKKIRVAGENK